MVATVDASPRPTKQQVIQAWDRLNEDSRRTLAQFAAFLRQQEAEHEEDLIMADPQLAQSLCEGNERYLRREMANCPLLEEVFPEDVLRTPRGKRVAGFAAA